MDLNAIRSKLASLNSGGNQDREKVDFDKIYWRPANGKSTIRIVPSAFNAADPFTEIKLHYGIGKFPMVSLSNYGKQDPVEEFVKELRKTSDKDNWSLSGKLSPKSRYFAPVIVRGEEEKGVRLWSFGINIYKALLALAEDEDIGDFTDVMNGWDMVVETTPAAGPGQFPTTTVRIKPKQTVLSDDDSKVSTWLKDQPNALEVQTQYDYDFIKKKLQEYLNPGEEVITPEEPEEPKTQPAKTSKAAKAEPTAETDLDKALGSNKTDFTLETAVAGNKSTVSKFDDLFN
jgi:hypothetical protein